MRNIKKSNYYNKDENIIDCWTTDVEHDKKLKDSNDLEQALRDNIEVALKDTMARERELGNLHDIMDVRIILDVHRKNYRQPFSNERLR